VNWKRSKGNVRHRRKWREEADGQIDIDRGVGLSVGLDSQGGDQPWSADEGRWRKWKERAGVVRRQLRSNRDSPESAAEPHDLDHKT
jgi:hypothetical protein